eukprot:476916-Ditylum_brightwellii.AAC.1
MVFEQHPMKWRTAYIRAGHSLQIDSLVEVVQYMANEKLFAKIEEAQKKRKRGDYDSRDNKTRATRNTKEEMERKGTTK